MTRRMQTPDGQVWDLDRAGLEQHLLRFRPGVVYLDDPETPQIAADSPADAASAPEAPESAPEPQQAPQSARESARQKRLDEGA